MSKLEILTDPNPLLHQKSKKVKIFDDKLKKLAHSMGQTLLEDNIYIGLAAPQIGQSIKLLAIEYDPKRVLPEEDWEKCKEKPIPLTYLVNPKITWYSPQKEIGDEGCLSLPDIEIPVERHREVNIVAQNLDGKKIKIRAKGFFAKIIQHEIDHLDGVLITDRANLKPSRIIFAGTPQFASTILKRLIKSPYKPYLVITEPDKPSGRGKKIEPNPVVSLAKENNIEIWQPDKISSIKTQISKLNPDILIVAAYGQFIPKEILAAPRFGCINVHPSLLPQYRGAAPIHSVILKGEAKTGLTIIKMDDRIDHGPILSQIEFPISRDYDTATLSDVLAHLGGNLLVNTLSLYLMGEIKPQKQNHKHATHSYKIKKEDGKIDWNEDSIVIERKIRAFKSWPGSYTVINGKKFKICQAHIDNGKLVIDRVQMEGKNEISFDEFQRGYKKNIDFLSKI